MISEAFHFPDMSMDQRHDVGLSVAVEKSDAGWDLVVGSTHLARWVHVVDPNYHAGTDWFHLRPGSTRRIPLIARNASVSSPPGGDVRALNSSGAVSY